MTVPNSGQWFHLILLTVQRMRVTREIGQGSNLHVYNRRHTTFMFLSLRFVGEVY